MLQSGHGSRDRRTDGQTDGQTDGVKPIYPPTTSLFGGYKKEIIQFLRLWHCLLNIQIDFKEACSTLDQIATKQYQNPQNNSIYSFAGVSGMSVKIKGVIG